MDDYTAKSPCAPKAIDKTYQLYISFIKKTYIDGIEFLRGESLEETQLNEIILSYSTHMATGYKN